jgi:hypothetical protein
LPNAGEPFGCQVVAITSNSELEFNEYVLGNIVGIDLPSENADDQSRAASAALQIGVLNLVEITKRYGLNVNTTFSSL